MKKNFKKNLLLGLLALTIFFIGFFSKDFYNELNSKVIQNIKPKNILLPDPKEGTYRVTKVLDGDTVILETGEKFRYLGIDAPEGNDRWGPEAKKLNEEMVLNKKMIRFFTSFIFLCKSLLKGLFFQGCKHLNSKQIFASYIGVQVR